MQQGAVKVLHRSRQRCRLEVSSKYRSADTIARVVSALRCNQRIARIQASPLTATLLVFGPAADEPEALAHAVADILHRDAYDASHNTSPRKTSDWHATRPSSVTESLLSDADLGLSAQDAADRLQRDGPNCLADPDLRSAWDIMKGQLNSAPVGVLIGSAVLSALTGGLTDAIMIAGVVAFNAAVGYRNEAGAESIIESIGMHGPRVAKVLRNGSAEHIPAEHVVVGDIIILEKGYVAADARILKAQHLTVDESMLTGENRPVIKLPVELPPATALPDRINMVFRGTVVTGGTGIGVVVATAVRTEIGNIQALVHHQGRPPTPLERQLEGLGRETAGLALAVCGLVLSVGMVRGAGGWQMLKLAVSLAVAAIPEGLTTVGTVTLAAGAQRLGRRHVLVRDLATVEALGRIERLCLDKTGTVTTNRMTAVALSTIHNSMRRLEGEWLAEFRRPVPLGFGDAMSLPEIQHLLTVAVLCSDADHSPEGSSSGSSTEVALLRLAEENGVAVERVRQTHRRLSLQARSEDRPWMETEHVNRETGQRMVSVKGNPEALLERVTHVMSHGTVVPLTEKHRQAIGKANQRLASRSLRILGFAHAKPDDTDSRLVWLGMVGLEDPPREGVAQVLRELRQAGIQTSLITGDQIGTARAIAKQLGLESETEVFARVSPGEKLKIVKRFQADHHVVAMTGDGVNDSPALRAADVGIAMGGAGTDTAREAADVVIADDDLRGLVTAIKQGRTIRANLKKAVRFLFATNLSEVLTTLCCMAVTGRTIFNPLQLLWINLITDVFPALALAMEPESRHVMRDAPPHSEATFFDLEERRSIGWDAAVMTLSTLGSYALTDQNGDEGRHGRDKLASTMGLLTLVFNQATYAAHLSDGLRAGTSSRRGNVHQVAVATVALQLLASAVPVLRQPLGLVGLKPSDVIAAASTGILPLFFVKGMGGRSSFITAVNNQGESDAVQHS